MAEQGGLLGAEIGLGGRFLGQVLVNLKGRQGAADPELTRPLRVDAGGGETGLCLDHLRLLLLEIGPDRLLGQLRQLLALADPVAHIRQDLVDALPADLRRDHRLLPSLQGAIGRNPGAPVFQLGRGGRDREGCLGLGRLGRQGKAEGCAQDQRKDRVADGVFLHK